MTGGSGTVTIGPLYAADAPRCAELEGLLFPGEDPWSAQAFRDELLMGHFYLAARHGGELIGYGGLALIGGPPDAESEIHTIGVHPDRQGRGIGRRLLSGLLTRADELTASVFLEVRTDNEPALALYRSEGFEQLGLRRNYYRPSGADAFTMRRPARRP
ncbi:MAG TPA: ribosomal protein S18-alanine N-acetyltransferase [Pseudonocardia sp.]